MSMTTVAYYESPKAGFDKRFFAGHYAYRDFKSATTSATFSYPTAISCGSRHSPAAKVLMGFFHVEKLDHCRQGSP